MCIQAIIKVTNTPSSAYRLTGGIFHDCAVHDIDLISWVLGEYPISVYTQATANVPGIKANGDVDCVAIILKFQSGIIGTIDLDRDAQYGYDQRLEVGISPSFVCLFMCLLCHTSF